MHGIGIKTMQGQRKSDECCLSQKQLMFLREETQHWWSDSPLIHFDGQWPKYLKPWVHQWFTFDMKANIVGKRVTCAILPN